MIVHGYKEWGTEVFDRLNGMFGLAIWDVPNQRLVVARDAMGIKLVYYKIDNGTLTFGSEIRPILAAEDSKPEVDPVALKLFLRFRYTPSPLTIFQGIRKLAPGTMLVVEKGQCREERWYNFTPMPFPRPKKEKEAAHELLELYKGAVRRHLLSDVPVGILLSGGLDSGLLLALMNEQGGSWPAYTIGYGDSFADDELRDAAETASLLGRAACNSEARSGRIRTVSSKDRRMSGRTDCSFLHRADVLRFSTRAPGCQSRADRSGPGRIIWRLQAAPGCSLWRVVARIARRSPLDDRLCRQRPAAQRDVKARRPFTRR